MQQHVSTQDSNFEAFSSFLTESLVSLRTNMNENHVVVMARIDHLISSQEADSGHYERFYQEICDFSDSQYRNEGQGWYQGERPMPRESERI